jgi:hypothetical protein
MNRDITLTPIPTPDAPLHTVSFLFGGVPGVVISGGILGAGYLYSNANPNASLLPTTSGSSSGGGGGANIRGMDSLPKTPAKC